MHQITCYRRKLDPRVLFVADLLPGGFFIAGGALRSLFDKTPLADIDIFMEQGADVEHLSGNLHSGGFKKTFTCPKGELHSWKHHSGLKVQLVCFVMGKPEQLLPLFDFTATQFALIPRMNYQLMLPSWDCARHARNKKLVINTVTHPYATFNRIGKYKKKGYYFSNEELHKFVTASSTIPFNAVDWAAYLD